MRSQFEESWEAIAVWGKLEDDHPWGKSGGDRPWGKSGGDRALGNSGDRPF
ncbi:MAG: hypothetical protein AB4426_25895 [Xenococcaceae cyanobacterium]